MKEQGQEDFDFMEEGVNYINKNNELTNKFKEDEKQNNITIEIYKLLLSKQYNIASEKITQYVKTKFNIYTLRDDKKDELWVYENGIYIPEGKSYIKQTCRNILGVAYNVKFVKEVIAKVMADSLISFDDFFNNNYVNQIPVLNGILNLKTKKLTPFTFDKIFFNKVNAEFKPGVDCPNIKNFFYQILDKQDVIAIQELIGYCLWKEYFIERAILFRGDGGNGKSKTLSLLKNFLNPKNTISVSLSQLENSGSFHICELQNRLVNMAGELSKRALEETEMFKSLVGRDNITADRKFLRPVTFVNFAKMIFNCNDRPPTYDLSDGFFRRWLVFHFKNKFVDQDVYDALEDKTNYGVKDTDIIEKISSAVEFSGLLNWALEGLNRLLSNKKFSNSKSTEDTRLEWLEDSNNFIVFFEKNMNISPSHLVSKDDLRVKYAEFCNSKNVIPVSDKAILWYLRNKGISSSRRTKDFNGFSEQVFCWIGCRFNDDSVDIKGWSNFVKIENKIEALKEFDNFEKSIGVVVENVEE